MVIYIHSLENELLGILSTCIICQVFLGSFSYIDLLLLFIALQRNLDFCILRKGIVRPQSQFPNSCVCERSTYIFPRSVHLFSCSRIQWADLHFTLQLWWNVVSVFELSHIRHILKCLLIFSYSVGLYRPCECRICVGSFKEKSKMLNIL